MSGWIDALRVWNATHNKGLWCVPRKGSSEHAELVGMMRPKTKKPRKKKETKSNPKPKSEPKSKPRKRRTLNTKAGKKGAMAYLEKEDNKK